MKRVVLVHPDGIDQILGVAPGAVPEVLADAGGALLATRGRLIPFASLFRVTTRAAYYREPMAPAPRAFHPGQV